MFYRQASRIFFCYHNLMPDIPTTNIDISHHLQRQVLLQLRQTGGQSYAELKPDGVKGNAYNYHLKNLKTAGLIELKDKLYELTPTGHIVADAFSSQSGRLVLRPHFYTYILVTQGDEVLLYKPSREPIPHLLSLPSGKLHHGDSFETSIKREMARRNLTDNYTAEHICPMTIRYMRDSEVVLHRAGNLWHIDYTGPRETSETASGTSSWFSRQAIADINDITPEIKMGLERIAANDHSPIDMTLTL